MLQAFYRVTGIPTNSVLLMDSREEATGWPRGDLVLGHCGTCGFVGNIAFDASLPQYSPKYEETQGFSPTFNAFADRLARQMVERHGVRNQTVLEIGCGKGEFLVRMCQFGDNRGIGIDPSYRPERTPAEWRERIRFIQDFYPGSYADLQADFVCCRHTLEHIQPTRRFVADVRAALGERREITVFFELPETLRVLEEGAFWDVYYEHCSYFTPGSLARVFRDTGYDVEELGLDFDDQYIILVARPAAGPTAARLPLEDDLARTAAAVERFRREGPASAARWGERIRSLAAQGRKVAIWGSGSKAVAFLTTIGLDAEIAAMVDINPHKQGRFMPGTGHQVVGPEALVAVRPDHVVVMNPIYCDEIRADLRRRGLEPELLPV